jgi:hypothetical protein
MPEPIQEPPDLYLESQPWAKYTGAGMYQRLAAMSIRRQRLRDQGKEVPRVPWLAMGVGAVLAALMVGGVFLLVLLVQWIARSMRPSTARAHALNLEASQLVVR